MFLVPMDTIMRTCIEALFTRNAAGYFKSYTSQCGIKRQRVCGTCRNAEFLIALNALVYRHIPALSIPKYPYPAFCAIKIPVMLQ
jgi:hypothetical protein